MEMSALLGILAGAATIIFTIDIILMIVWMVMP